MVCSLTRGAFTKPYLVSISIKALSRMGTAGGEAKKHLGQVAGVRSQHVLESAESKE